MKTLWLVISAVALANLLATAGFIAWLGTSDRLDRGRVTRIRSMLAETVTAETARTAEDAARAAEEAKSAEARAKEATLPVTSAELLQAKIERSQVDDERLDRMRKEAQNLQTLLANERAKLDEERKAFLAEKAAFEDMRKKIAETESNAQFKKALTTYEGLKPDQAKSGLAELLKRSETEQVVAYLNAMQDRTRTKVITEFLKDDPKTAADLLERLRTRGMKVPAS